MVLSVRYLFDIVSNKRNGVDVDKFDYLPRDGLMVSHSISFDFRKAMNGFKARAGRGAIGPWRVGMEGSGEQGV